jgi:hypothetical protein
MTTKKILVVDFKNKKVTGAYEGPSGQTLTIVRPSFIPLTSGIERVDSKRLTESIDRIDRMIRELADLTKKENDKDGN